MSEKSSVTWELNQMSLGFYMQWGEPVKTGFLLKMSLHVIEYIFSNLFSWQISIGVETSKHINKSKKAYQIVSVNINLPCLIGLD